MDCLLVCLKINERNTRKNLDTGCTCSLVCHTACISSSSRKIRNEERRSRGGTPGAVDGHGGDKARSTADLRAFLRFQIRVDPETRLPVCSQAISNKQQHPRTATEIPQGALQHEKGM
jgi:hypothetical protein